jgi:hypothetical protein
MKNLLSIILVLALLSFTARYADAQSPLYVYCVSATSTQCNVTSNPGTGNQGDAAWLAFGKVNSDLSFLSPLWSLTANELVGSTTAGTLGPIVLGTNLSMTGNVLNATGGGGGGGGTPGGTSGQIQFNNGIGGFGGFTMSQDCSINTTTGAISCLRTNNIPFGLLATATTNAPVISLWLGSCSSTTYLRGDGTCVTPSGAGTLNASGSPIAGALNSWVDATHIGNANLSGDCLTTNSTATTCAGASSQFIAVTSTCTLSLTNNSATANAAGGAITCTLPTAISDNHIYCVTKTDSTANTVTINTTLAQTIQGNANEVIQFKGNTMCVKSDNANWWII